MADWKIGCSARTHVKSLVVLLVLAVVHSGTQLRHDQWKEGIFGIVRAEGVVDSMTEQQTPVVHVLRGERDVVSEPKQQAKEEDRAVGRPGEDKRDGISGSAKRLIEKYYEMFDDTLLMYHVPVIFTREASLHLVMPLIPDKFFDNNEMCYSPHHLPGKRRFLSEMEKEEKTDEEEHNEISPDGCCEKWVDWHIQGAHELERSTTAYLKRLPKHKTYYEIRILEPAVGQAVNAVVSGIMKVEGHRLERFVQTFLMVSEHGNKGHKIRFSTITGGILHQCSGNPDAEQAELRTEVEAYEQKQQKKLSEM